MDRLRIMICMFLAALQGWAPVMMTGCTFCSAAEWDLCHE